MNKIIRYFKGISNIILVALIILNVINLAWYFGAKGLHWPTYSKIAHIIGWTLILSSCLLLPIALFSTFRISVKALAISAMSIIFCFELITISLIPVYVDAITTNGKTLILAKYGEDHGGTCYRLLECKVNQTGCEEAKPELDYCTGNFDPYVMTSGTIGDLDIFFNGRLAYTYGPASYSNEFRDAVIYKNHIYWTVQARHTEDPSFVFGRCDNATRQSCEILQTYLDTEFQHMNLAIDNKGNELFMLFDGILTHTLGKMSEEFDILASVHTEHSLIHNGPSIYSISVRELDNKHEYILYECNARYFWCEIYPFHYSTTSKEKAALVIEDGKKELNIYINDRLISNWNDHPVCYVEGCEILQK